MRLKEYEGKRLFKEAGIQIPEGILVTSLKEALSAAEEIGFPLALKAQILAGKRGLSGGILFAENLEEVKKGALQLLGNIISQFPVREILIEKKLEIAAEYYLSLTLDRNTKGPVLLASVLRKGFHVEDQAHLDPTTIVQEKIDALMGVNLHTGYNLFGSFGLSSTTLASLASVTNRIFQIFKKKEATLVEINPLIENFQGEMVALDAKILLDPRASYSKKEERPRFIPLDGEIGILANGAGLTMSTMDLVKEYGGSPANFLEIGGEFYKQAGSSLTYLLDNCAHLKGLLVNLFGAYARTDTIISQVIEVLEDRRPEFPISFRIRGTGEDRARELLWERLKKKAHLDLEEALEELFASLP